MRSTYRSDSRDGTCRARCVTAPATSPAPVASTAPAASTPPAPATHAVAQTPAAVPSADAVTATPLQTDPASLPALNSPTADPAAGTQPPAETPTEKPAERVAAKAGVGEQGQSLKEHTGVIVEAAKAYFNVRQRAVFEIQIPEALKLYEATEGRKPKSHDEFMSKVIAANQIKLPDLPAR